MTWVWVNSGSGWWTGRPGVLQSMGSQRARHDWATELNWSSELGEVTCLYFYHDVVPFLKNDDVASVYMWAKGVRACLCCFVWVLGLDGQHTGPPVPEQGLNPGASQVAQRCRTACQGRTQETRVDGSLNWDDPLEKEMATQASILGWLIPWTEQPGGLQSWGRQESDTAEQLSRHTPLPCKLESRPLESRESPRRFFFFFT